MSTPTIWAVRKKFPNARLDFFVGSWSRCAVVGNPHLDNIVDCGSVGAGSVSLGEYWALVRQLRKGGYDVCFVLERSVLMTLLPLLAGIPYRIGLDSEGRGFSLTVKVSCSGTKHEADRYLDTVRAIGADTNRRRLEFYPTERDVQRAQDLLVAAGVMQLGSADGGGPPASARTPIVVIHPAGGANPGMELLAKRWPAERFAAIADLLIEQYGATVVIVGAKADIPVAADMERSMEKQPVNLAGKTTIGELAGVFTYSDLFLGNDTGPLHLAVAVGVTTVAIFGPTDARVYGPYSDESTAVSGAVPCRPCFVKGAARPCSTFECMTSVSIEQVWRAVGERLEAKGFRQANSTVERSV